MTASHNTHRPFGKTGILAPPIAFRSDVLDNPLPVLPDQTKRLICGEWIRRIKPPAFIEVALKENRGSGLSTLGRLLPLLEVTPDEVIINLECDAQRASRNLAQPRPIQTQFDEACDLLGKNYAPRFVTLRIATDDDATDSMHELEALKVRHQLAAVGIALDDWRLGHAILEVAQVDFIKLLNGPTVLRHTPEMLAWLADLAAHSIPVITAGVFHGGFLAGGAMFDGRRSNSDAPADKSLLAWRKAFTSLCHGHGVRPAHACIQFALGVPGIVAESLRTSHVDRVAEVVDAATTPVPSGLWASMKEEGLLAHVYGDVSR